MHTEQSLRRLVVRDELLIVERPGGREPVCVLNRGEVARTETRQRCAVDLRVPAHGVRQPWFIPLAVRGLPAVAGAVATIDEDGVRTPVLGLGRDEIPPLQDQDLRARVRQRIPSVPPPIPLPTITMS